MKEVAGMLIRYEEVSRRSFDGVYVSPLVPAVQWADTNLAPRLDALYVNAPLLKQLLLKKTFSVGGLDKEELACALSLVATARETDRPCDCGEQPSLGLTGLCRNDAIRVLTAN
jgi:hypothetical protein